MLVFVAVSIHAPGRGATYKFKRYGRASEFQFTHPGGVRRRYSLYGSFLLSVSIHAPGRGATTPQRYTILTTHMFQFTHPGGVRPICLEAKRLTARVSIHAPGRGATDDLRTFTSLRVVSIHAPGRGATTYSESS